MYTVNKQPECFVEEWDENLTATTLKNNRCSPETDRSKCQKQSGNGCNASADAFAGDFAAIFLVRNPWNAFFSRFQGTRPRHGYGRDGHVHNLMASDLGKNPQTILNSDLFVVWAQDWIRTFEIYERFKAQHRETLLLFFEADLMSVDGFWKLLEFLMEENYLQKHETEWKRKLRCIFDARVRLPRYESIHRPKVDPKWSNASLYVTRDRLYQLFDDSVLCRVWGVLAAHVEKYIPFQHDYDQVSRDKNCSL